jgi:hypothetical protein
VIVAVTASDIRTWDGAHWTNVPGPFVDDGTAVDALVGPGGELYLVPVSTGGTPDAGAPYAIMRLRQGVWESLGVPSFGWPTSWWGMQTRSVIDASGTLFVAHRATDGSATYVPYGAPQTISIHRLVDSHWELVGERGAVAGGAFDVAVAPDGSILLAVVVPPGDFTRVVAFRGGCWKQLGSLLGETNVGIAYGDVLRPSLAISAGGDVYVTYRARGPIPSTTHMMVAKWSGADWTSLEPLDSLNVENATLQFMPDGTLYATYSAAVYAIKRSK